MTVKEAKGKLEGVYDYVIPKSREKRCFFEKAIDIAIESMEKQIPKFVECKEWKGYRDTRYKCPSCGKNVRNDETYCHKCGQAIKFPKLKKVDNRLELDWEEGGTSE